MDGEARVGKHLVERHWLGGSQWFFACSDRAHARAFPLSVCATDPQGRGIHGLVTRQNMACVGGFSHPSLAPWATLANPRSSKRRKPQLADVVRNGQPFAFKGAQGPVILCLLPKVGSTTWKLALLSALHPRRHGWLLERSPHQRRHIHELPSFASAKLRRAVRIVLVRNPYDRLLSAYLDKMVLQRKAKLAPGGFEPGGSFEHFLGNLTLLDPAKVDIHYRPMSLQCGMPAMSYDFILRVEEMAAWYEPFVRLLGLEQTVQTGWNVSTKWWRGSAGGCFYVPPGRDCAAMFRTPCRDILALPPAQLSTMAGVRPASFHATHAASRRAEFYRGEAARMASRWLQGDLVRFGYDRCPRR